MSEGKSIVTLNLVVNADPQEAWEIIDRWVGTTAPEEIDSVHWDSNDIQEVSS